MIFISPCVETRIDTFIDESGRVVLLIIRQTFWCRKICLIKQNWLNVLFGHRSTKLRDLTIDVFAKSFPYNNSILVFQ